MISVLRREEKYALNVSEAVAYTDRFSKIMMPDKFSKNGNYMVRSLYFDTVDDADFFDKLNEQNLRRKIRLRIYDPSDKTAKLELKQKENIYHKGFQGSYLKPLWDMQDLHLWVLIFNR